MREIVLLCAWYKVCGQVPRPRQVPLHLYPIQHHDVILTLPPLLCLWAIRCNLISWSTWICLCYNHMDTNKKETLSDPIRWNLVSLSAPPLLHAPLRIGITMDFILPINFLYGWEWTVFKLKLMRFASSFHI